MQTPHLFQTGKPVMQKTPALFATQRHVDGLRNHAHDFYARVIEKVMEKMDNSLQSQGLDVEQIDQFRHVCRPRDSPQDVAAELLRP